MLGLLVSVKNRAEATAAVTGGTDILDIKDPNNGALGMASLKTIGSILEQFEQNQSIRTSVALGELEDWPAAKPIPSSLNHTDYLKIGPGQSTDLDQWFENLLNIVHRFRSAGIEYPDWIAVLYAETLPGRFFNQPEKNPITELTAKLKKNEFAGLLIDTVDKKNGSLRSHLSDAQLREITAELHSQNLLCSFAGRLSFAEIDLLLQKKVYPDYYAVRSAVCTANNRQAEVEQGKVQRLKELLGYSQGEPGMLIPE